MKALKTKLNSGKKGFTLAELLIVVAIIAVLVAIAIPVFSAQLTRATNGVIVANARACKAEAMSQYIASGKTSGDEIYYYTVTKDGTFAPVASTAAATTDCPTGGWAYKVTVNGNTTTIVYGTSGKVSAAAETLPAL